MQAANPLNYGFEAIPILTIWGPEDKGTLLFAWVALNENANSCCASLNHSSELISQLEQPMQAAKPIKLWV